MQLRDLRRSSSVKVLGIAFLILVLLVPVAMTRNVIHDRQAIGWDARQDIMRSWGQPQTVGGPMLVVPYKIALLGPQGNQIEEDGEVYLSPENLEVDAIVTPEVRYRGLHKVPVYTANMEIRGSFAATNVSGLGIDSARFDWERAYFALTITDAKSIRNTPQIEIANGVGSRSLRFVPGGNQSSGYPPNIVAVANGILDDATRIAPFNFSLNLDVSGTDSLRFLPLGDANSVAVRSSWASPSFVGGYLPESREVADDGFSANWRLASLGRETPSRWLLNSYHFQPTDQSSFGVDFFMPIGLYQLTDRATKYGILFIGLTFVGYFLFEVIARLQLHPLQYLLVGFANTLFYLLLLSFAEHLGFGWSYLVSAVASISLIGGYSASILKGRGRALLIVGMLICLYAFLYLTLKAESYAMLAGALGLWFSLAVIMYLTRRIDWYRWGEPSDGSPVD